MKQIIIPMDFTDTSANALKYAYDMFGNNYEYKLIHSTPGLSTLNNGIEPALLEGVLESLDKRLVKLALLALNKDLLPSNFSTEVLIGNTVPSIVSYVKESTNTKAVVVGTRDKYDLFDKWVGTTSLGLIKKLEIPVYLIPVYSTYKCLSKVVVASDTEIGQANKLTNISKWSSENGANIKFLYVNTTNEENENRDKILETINESGEFWKDYFEFDVINGNNVADSILAYAYNYHADMITVFPNKHSLLHTMVFKSVSKGLVLKANIPILFFPKNFDYAHEGMQAHWDFWKTDSISE